MALSSDGPDILDILFDQEDGLLKEEISSAHTVDLVSECNTVGLPFADLFIQMLADEIEIWMWVAPLFYLYDVS